MFEEELLKNVRHCAKKKFHKNHIYEIFKNRNFSKAVTTHWYIGPYGRCRLWAFPASCEKSEISNCLSWKGMIMLVVAASLCHFYPGRTVLKQVKEVGSRNFENLRNFPYFFCGRSNVSLAIRTLTKGMYESVAKGLNVVCR